MEKGVHLEAHSYFWNAMKDLSQNCLPAGYTSLCSLDCMLVKHPLKYREGTAQSALMFFWNALEKATGLSALSLLCSRPAPHTKCVMMELHLLSIILVLSWW